MAEISASLVKELRERTGLGMMECKKALVEAGGDAGRAEELLRIRSGAKAGKAASRIAAEGAIGAWLADDAKLGAIVEVNCETDFVAKNVELLAFANQLAEAVAKSNPADAQALAGLTVAGANAEARRQALVQRIGENIALRRFARVETRARIALYLHTDRKTGVLVEFEGAEDAGKDVAMHVAFHKPAYLAKADVPAQLVAREREILVARASESGKPAGIAARRVEGGLNKFLAEIALLGQPFVKDDKQTVEKMLAARKSKLLGYRFLVVGEGLQKKNTDFAAEVKAAAEQVR